jgi:hypothetical protein
LMRFIPKPSQQWASMQRNYPALLATHKHQ